MFNGFDPRQMMARFGFGGGSQQTPALGGELARMFGQKPQGMMSAMGAGGDQQSAQAMAIDPAKQAMFEQRAPAMAKAFMGGGGGVGGGGTLGMGGGMSGFQDKANKAAAGLQGAGGQQPAAPAGPTGAPMRWRDWASADQQAKVKGRQ